MDLDARNRAHAIHSSLALIAAMLPSPQAYNRNAEFPQKHNSLTAVFRVFYAAAGILYMNVRMYMLRAEFGSKLLAEAKTSGRKRECSRKAQIKGGNL